MLINALDSCYACAVCPTGQWRHYVFNLSIHLCVFVCTWVLAQQRQSPAGLPSTSHFNCFCGYYLLYYFSSALEMCGNGLQHFRALPFPSVHSHSCDASDLIPIPTPLPKFIPILSHSHSHLTNERHLSLNKSDDKFSKCKHSAVWDSNLNWPVEI